MPYSDKTNLTLRIGRVICDTKEIICWWFQ